MNYPIGLTQAELQAIFILRKSLHWLNNLSDTGQNLLKKFDLAMILVEPDGYWKYRTLYDRQMYIKQGKPCDPNALQEGIQSLPIFEELVRVFSQRPLDEKASISILAHIEAQPTPDSIKEVLMVNIGSELRYTAGENLPRLLANPKYGKAMGTAIQLAAQKERLRIEAINAGNVVTVNEERYTQLMANALQDPSLWKPSDYNNQAFVFRGFPGIETYAVFAKQADGRIFNTGDYGAVQNMLRSNKMSLYCSYQDQENVLQVDSVQLAHRLY